MGALDTVGKASSFSSWLLVITGALSQGVGGSYDANFNGNITATGDIRAGAISLESHVHSGVQTGSGNTGAPL